MFSFFSNDHSFPNKLPVCSLKALNSQSHGKSLIAHLFFAVFLIDISVTWFASKSINACLFLSLFKGITFDEFRCFFQFLNNLEDFAIAMQMYNFASRSIGQGWDRAVKATVIGTCGPLFLWDTQYLSLSPARWVCESSICGHRSQADTPLGQHYLQDLWRGSRWPALLQGVHWHHEGQAAPRRQGEEVAFQMTCTNGNFLMRSGTWFSDLHSFMYCIYAVCSRIINRPLKTQS